MEQHVMWHDKVYWLQNWIGFSKGCFFMSELVKYIFYLFIFYYIFLPVLYFS